MNVCSICKNGFKIFRNAQKHMKNEHGIPEGKIKNVTLKIKSDANFSKSTVIPQETLNKNLYRTFPCSIEKCKLKFLSDDLRSIHENCHDGLSTFRCPHCSQLFRNWPFCALHLDSKHSTDCGLLPCSACSSFKTWKMVDLRNHMRIHNELKIYSCTYCNCTFKQVTQLRSHLTKHSKRNENRLVTRQCLTCLKFFSNAKSLKKHKNEVHNKLRPFVCNVCGHESARKWLLELHQRQHTGAKVHFCTLCPYKTADQNSLKRHQMRHNGIRPYKCSKCELTFLSAYNCKRHILKQHEDAAEGVLSCSFCSFKTVSGEKFNRHISDHLTGLIKHEHNQDVPDHLMTAYPLWFSAGNASVDKPDDTEVT